MRAEEIEHLYTRVRSGGGGSGLGTLSILDAVVRLRGALEVESSPGAGTTVRVCFPGGSCGPEVLLLDPWSVRGEARTARLTGQGACVRRAADPSEALEQLDVGTARILVARGVVGTGLATLIERARNLGVPIDWIGAGVTPAWPDRATPSAAVSE